MMTPADILAAATNCIRGNQSTPSIPTALERMTDALTEIAAGADDPAAVARDAMGAVDPPPEWAQDWRVVREA